ncbi:hypothetical protein BGZ94_007010 [Podila epigama]|nr:hypothetical protein BGZ94_007010 [Podila epigama]
MNPAFNDNNESAPLLNQRFRDVRKEREQDRKIRALTIVSTVLGLFVLLEFLTGLYFDNKGYGFVKEPSYPVPAKVTPVCDLEHVEGVHHLTTIAGPDNFQVFQFLLDDGIAGDINVSVNNDPEDTDIYVIQTWKFSHSSIEPHLRLESLYNYIPVSPSFSLSYMLNYTIDERRAFLQDRHRCASVDMRIVFPQYYPFDRLDLQTLYKGNINIDFEDRIITKLYAKTAYGNINIKRTGSADFHLEAPAGGINMSVNAFHKLETFSSENTHIDLVGVPFLLDLHSISEKHLTVKYPYKGHFTLSSTKRPALTGNLDVPITFTKNTKNTLEGFIGVDWLNEDALPRMFLTAYQTKLFLKDPYDDDELQAEKKKLEKYGFYFASSQGVFSNKKPAVMRRKKVAKSEK